MADAARYSSMANVTMGAARGVALKAEPPSFSSGATGHVGGATGHVPGATGHVPGATGHVPALPGLALAGGKVTPPVPSPDESLCLYPHHHLLGGRIVEHRQRNPTSPLKTSPDERRPLVNVCCFLFIHRAPKSHDLSHAKE